MRKRLSPGALGGSAASRTPRSVPVPGMLLAGTVTAALANLHRAWGGQAKMPCSKLEAVPPDAGT